MPLDVDPKVDYAFKHLFGHDATRPLLIDMLNSVMAPGPGQAIEDLDLLNPFNPKEALDDKLSFSISRPATSPAGSSISRCRCWLCLTMKSGFFTTGRGCNQHQLREGKDYLER